MPNTVNTSTVTYATRVPFQRLSFYANGRYWVFYGDGTNFVYRTSVNGAAWTAATILHAGDIAAWCSVVFDGTYVHYCCTEGTSDVPIYYRRGTPNGDGEITWSAGEQIAVAARLVVFQDPGLAIDSNGYPFISYLDELDCYCAKSSENDGTWVLDWDVLIKAYSADYVFSSIVPLTATKMYIVYGEWSDVFYGKLWDGADWGEEEAVSASTTEEIDACFCVTSIGDDVHLAFLKEVTNDILYVKRAFGVGWGADEIVQLGASPTSSPVISHDGDRIYVLWAGAPTADHIYYRTRNGIWADSVDWLDESAQGLTRNDGLSCYFESYSGALCAIWLTLSESPFNVRHDCVLSPVPPVVGLENKSANMGAKMMAGKLI